MKDSWDQYKNDMATKMKREVKFSKVCFPKSWIHLLFPCWWLPNLYLSCDSAAQAPGPALHSLAFFDLDVLLYLTLHTSTGTHTFPEQVPSNIHGIRSWRSLFLSPFSCLVSLCWEKWLDIKRYMVYKILSCVWSHGSSSYQLGKVKGAIVTASVLKMKKQRHGRFPRCTLYRLTKGTTRIVRPVQPWGQGSSCP